MAPAPPDSSSDSSPKRLIGSDATVSDSASGSARSVSGLRSSSVSCRRSRLTVFGYSWDPPLRGSKKATPTSPPPGRRTEPTRQITSCTARITDDRGGRAEHPHALSDTRPIAHAAAIADRGPHGGADGGPHHGPDSDSDGHSYGGPDSSSYGGSACACLGAGAAAHPVVER